METSIAIQSFVAAKSVRWADRSRETAELHLLTFSRAYAVLPETPEPIEAFLAEIPGTTYRHNHYRTLHNLYAWLERRKKIAANPMTVVEQPTKPRTVPYYLNEHELLALLTHPSHPPRDRALLYLLADTGMRIGEAHGITVGAIKDTYILVDGKTGPRFVPVSPDVVALLRGLGAQRGPVWRGIRGPMSLSGLKTLVRKAFRRAGFEGRRMSAHRLRHSFCTIWDGSDSDGMAITGHRDHRAWEIYRHVRMGRIAASHQAHGPLAILQTQMQALAANPRP